MEHCHFPVHIECALRTDVDENAIRKSILEMLTDSVCCFEDGPINYIEYPELCEHLSFIVVCDLGPGVSVSYWEAHLVLHVFRMIEAEGQKDYLENSDSLPACEQWVLPCLALCTSLWDSVIVERDVKSQLLGYAAATTMFADRNVDKDIVSWNRMILLHGPPGTGKTTLCRALAQKIFIHSDPGRFQSGVLVEINSHSLFSKWFSESGKLVMQLFEHIEELAEDPNCFVAVLIDEVESLAASRAGLGAEPGDATRSVNAVLTSLDALRHRSNIIVLGTSNLAHGIDEAFLDRLDLCLEIGLPGLAARHQILLSCLHELIRKGIVLEPSHTSVVWGEDCEFARHLLETARRSENLSGRMLRKAPLKAHAVFLQRHPVSLQEYLNALRNTVSSEVQNMTKLVPRINHRTKHSAVETPPSGTETDSMECDDTPVSDEKETITNMSAVDQENRVPANNSSNILIGCVANNSSNIRARCVPSGATITTTLP